MAKKTHIYGIKVLDSTGRGPYSGIIAGINHVPRDAQQRNCPNGVVVNLSLGGPYSQATNDAVRGLTNRGIFVAVAAGNENDDASRYSPASEPSACTVGGSAKYDERYTQSNYGRSVDIIGPAVDVYSTYPNGRAVSHTETNATRIANAVLGIQYRYFHGISSYRRSRRIPCYSRGNPGSRYLQENSGACHSRYGQKPALQHCKPDCFQRKPR